MAAYTTIDDLLDALDTSALRTPRTSVVVREDDYLYIQVYVLMPDGDIQVFDEASDTWDAAILNAYNAALTAIGE